MTDRADRLGWGRQERRKRAGRPTGVQVGGGGEHRRAHRVREDHTHQRHRAVGHRRHPHPPQSPAERPRAGIRTRTDPRNKLVAQLSQNMHFLADMKVGEFLDMHARSRGKDHSLVPRVVEAANLLTGEAITMDCHLTALSGGQSRALMAADIAIISDSPIVLIDEIENAGIRKQEGLRLLAGSGKIVVVVTHDPLLALLASRRVVMSEGGMRQVVGRTEEEVRGLRPAGQDRRWLYLTAGHDSRRQVWWDPT